MTQLSLSRAAPDEQRNAFQVVVDAALILFCIFFSLAATYRWFGEGRDYSAYLAYYETIPNSLSFADTRFEPGFHFIAWLFATVFRTSFQLFFFVIALLSLALKFLLFKKYLRWPVAAAIVYLLMIYPIHEYTQMRAAIAISIGLVAIHFWMSDRQVLSTSFMILGFLLHSSMSVLFAAFLFAEYVRWNWSGASFIAVFVLFSATLIILNVSIVGAFSVYNPLVTNYLENSTLQEEARFFSLGNILYILLLIAAFLAKWHVGRYRRVFFIIGVISVFSLAIFSASPTVAQRIKEVLFGSIIFCAFRSKFDRRDIAALVLLGANALALNWLSVQNGVLFDG